MTMYCSHQRRDTTQESWAIIESRCPDCWRGHRDMVCGLIPRMQFQLPALIYDRFDCNLP